MNLNEAIRMRIDYFLKRKGLTSLWELYKSSGVPKSTLRLPDKLHKEVPEYSTKHNISMNTLILNCIEYALDNREDY